MATVQITTWDEFKTALTETITEATTYEIMNDIDVSGEIITAQINIQGNYSKIINGNEFKLNGLTTYISGTNACIFRVYTNDITFNKLYFSNFMASGAYLFYSNNSTTHIFFNECFFNGLAKIILYGPFNSDKCSFNCAYDSNEYMLTGSNHTNAYIIIDGTLIAPTNANSKQHLSGTYTNCYIGGKAFFTSGNSYLLGGSFRNSVINVEFQNSPTYPKTSGSLSLTGNVTSSGYYTLVNKDKIEIEGLTWTDYNRIYALTDTQIKSKTYIQENTNFPLYG